MSGPDHKAADGVVQRTVSAADAPPLQARAGSSVFNWRRHGGGAAPDTTADTQSQPEEEETMATAKKKRAPRKNSSGSPQLQICSALLQNDLARDAIAQALPDLTTAQISSALNNAKSHGRVAWIEKDQVYRLTKTGKAWVAAATGTEEPAAPTAGKTRRKGGHRRGRTAKARPRKWIRLQPPTKRIPPSAALS
jgi:hypothetical protein